MTTGHDYGTFEPEAHYAKLKWTIKVPTDLTIDELTVKPPVGKIGRAVDRLSASWEAENLVVQTYTIDVRCLFKKG